MFEAVGAIIAAVIKAGVPIYIATPIASVLLLFLPDFIAHQMGVIEFRSCIGDISAVHWWPR